jgi:predicted lipoprotein with Yx(FWY)xxD motif
MKLRMATGLAGAALALVLTGCAGGAGSNGTSNGGGSGYGYGGGSTSQSAAPKTSSAALMTSDSDLGQIVVDGKGMTVYMFDQDTQNSGTSTCEGQCAANWPAVTTDSTTPKVEGVTGTVATIKGTDGSTQVTLNGWPLYHYAGDSAAGDTNGQGVNSVWWVLDPAGQKIGG